MEKWFEIKANIVTNYGVTKTEVARSLREFFESKNWDWIDGFVKELESAGDPEDDLWDESGVDPSID